MQISDLILSLVYISKQIKMNTIDPITLVIIGITVAISFKGFKDRFFFDQYKFLISKIQQGEKIRILSSGFLHVDQSHLIFNMLTLYFFANSVIYNVGKINFVIIYLGSLLAGGLLGMFFHKKEPFYSAVGASGAVMGIVYSGIILNPSLEIYFLPAWIFAIGYLIYSIYGMKNKVGNIGHSAHLGGAIGGFILTLLFQPSVMDYNRYLVIGLAVLTVLLFIFKDKIKV